MADRLSFFTDEDVYSAVAPALRRAGFDAHSTPEVGCLGATDDEQLAWAAAQGHALVTFNVAHFAQLHQSWMQKGSHHGGIVLSEQRSVGDTIRRLIHLGQSLTRHDMQDRLEFLGNW